MSAIYYVIDPNGDIYSEDKQSRFTALRGASLDAFIKSEEAKKRYFSRTRDEKDNLICVEIPQNKVSEYEAQRLHSLYLSKFEEEYQIMSLDAPISDEEAEPLESQIADPDEDVENNVLNNEKNNAIYSAMSQLKTTELRVIQLFYFSKEKLTDADIGLILGISQQIVNYYRQRAEKKLEKILKKVL